MSPAGPNRQAPPGGVPKLSSAPPKLVMALSSQSSAAGKPLQQQLLSCDDYEGNNPVSAFSPQPLAACVDSIQEEYGTSAANRMAGRNSNGADTPGLNRVAGFEATSSNTKSTKLVKNEYLGFTPVSERESLPGKLHTAAYQTSSGGTEAKRLSAQRQGQTQGRPEADGGSEDGGRKYYLLGNSAQPVFKGHNSKYSRDAGTPLGPPSQYRHSPTPAAQSWTAREQKIADEADLDRGARRYSDDQIQVDWSHPSAQARSFPATQDGPREAEEEITSFQK